MTQIATQTLAEHLDVKVGTIFYNSWGYEQTNVDFYQVVGITPSGKSVRLRAVRKGVTTAEVDIPGIGVRSKTGVVAISDNFVDDEADAFIKLLQIAYDGKTACTAFNSYSSLSLWDGTPQYDTCALGYTGH